MKKIGQLIEKKRIESKFKKAGTGHSLQEERKVPDAGPSRPAARTTPSLSAQEAGQKALERFEQGQRKPKRDLTVLKSQVKEEVESEQQGAAAASSASNRPQRNQPSPAFHDQDAPVAVSGIFYQCPLCATTAKQPDLTGHMDECFLTIVAADPLQGTCTMLNSLNRDSEKLKGGKDILYKYLDNVCNNPDEEKYRKIRIGNKAFQERVLPLKGTLEFLQAVGFQQKELPHQDVPELFWVLSEEYAIDTDRLTAWRDQLQTSESIRPTLSRDMKVLRPSGSAQRIHLPDEFFRITGEEAKKEQENRKEVIEKSERLRTKAMKAADEQNEKRQYRYSLIRVRFPDGYVLQGTFHARDRFSEVVSFVRSSLVNDWQPFILSDPTGPLLEKESASLLQLKLAPAAQLMFSWDPQIAAEITAAQGSTEAASPLKPELIAASQTL